MLSRIIQRASRRAPRLIAKQAAKALKSTVKVTRAAVRQGNKAVQQTNKAVRRTTRAVKTLESEQTSRPPGRFTVVDGVRVHYIARGKGRPVVLIHGNGTMAEDFVICGLVDRLAERYRVIAIDRPGFGHTDRPRSRVWTASAQAHLVHRVLERLKVERPVIVGHSWGTLVALVLAVGGWRECVAWCFCPATTTQLGAPTWPSRPRSRSRVLGTQPGPWCHRWLVICLPPRCSGTCSGHNLCPPASRPGSRSNRD